MTLAFLGWLSAPPRIAAQEAAPSAPPPARNPAPTDAGLLSPEILPAGPGSPTREELQLWNDTLQPWLLKGEESPLLEWLEAHRDRIKSLEECGFPVLGLACDFRLTNVVEWLIAHGADVNARNSARFDAHAASHLSSFTPLDWAVEGGVPSFVGQLLDAGAELNPTNTVRFQVRPLEHAVSLLVDDLRWPGGSRRRLSPASAFPSSSANLPTAADRREVVRLLLDRGAKLFDESGSPGGSSLLQQAARSLEVLDLLLTNSRPRDARSAEGDTLLHIAASSGRLEALDVLLGAGLSPTATNHFGLTPLHQVASMARRAAVARPGALAAPAPVPQFTSMFTAPGRDHRDMTAAVADRLLAAGARHDLFTAAGLGDTNALASLLVQEPNGLRRHGPDGLTTPLHWAIRSRQTAAVQWLVEHGAPVAATDADGNTPLHSAISGDVSEVVPILLEAHAPLAITNRLGETPVSLATRDLATFQLLLKAGASVEPDPPGAIPPLIAAFQKGPRSLVPDVIELLIVHDANLSVTNREGRTVIHLLTEREGPLEIIEELVACGANLEARDTNGNTALHLAVTKPQALGLYQPRPDWIHRFTQGGQWRRNFINWLEKRGVIAPTPATTNVCVVDFLISLGADVRATNALGFTPLQSLNLGDLPAVDSQAHPFLVTARKLIADTAALKERDRNGDTPLLAAVRYGQFLWAQDLLRLGADHRVCDKSGNTVLHLALANPEARQFDLGHALAFIKEMLNRGLSWSATNRAGDPPLHFALQQPSRAQELQQPSRAPELGRPPRTQGQWEPSRELIDACLDLETNTANAILHLTNSQGDTPLHLAIKHRGYDVVETLCRRGADVQARNVAGETPLLLAHQACNPFMTQSRAPLSQTPAALRARLAALRARIAAFRARMGSPTIDLHVLLPNTTNSIRSAVDAGDTNTVARYLEAEPRLATTPNAARQLLIDQTVPRLRIDVARQLLAAGSPLTPGAAVMLGRIDALPGLCEPLAPPERDVLLFTAVDACQPAALRWLLEHGADPNVQDNAGRTLKSRLGSGDDVGLGDLLTAHGAEPSLFDALAVNNTELAERLLRQRPALAARVNSSGQTPLLRAVLATNDAVFRLLLELNADVRQATPRAFTPLHAAAAVGRADFATNLLARGADPNARDQFLNTPLHWAARVGATNVAEVLLQAGADVNDPPGAPEPPRGDSGTRGLGNTPLHVAVESGQAATVAWLLEHGADRSSVNPLGLTPLEAARQERPTLLPCIAEPGLPTEALQRDETQRDAIVQLLEAAGQ